MSAFSNRLTRVAAHLHPAAASPAASQAVTPLEIRLRYRDEDGGGEGVRLESWAPQETAIIVCDMWNLHPCLNATRYAHPYPRAAPRLPSERWPAVLPPRGHR